MWTLVQSPFCGWLVGKFAKREFIMDVNNQIGVEALCFGSEFGT